MSFTGFFRQTCDYFFSIYSDNSRENFAENKAVYNECVKTPLIELHSELVPVINNIDGNICVRQSRCVSGAYNDARFSKASPIKGYMYLHFLATGRETDVPGFFMDASFEGYRYGLQLYHATTKGMRSLRESAYNKQEHFAELVSGIEVRDIFSLEGKDYKTDRYPDVSTQTKGWLNKKCWWIGADLPIDEDFLSAVLSKKLADGFISLAPMYEFIKEALSV